MVVEKEAADQLWDRIYANLENLYENQWVGLATLWGYHHRTE